MRWENCTVENGRIVEHPRRNKYRNIKTEVEGIIFDSKKEAARYQELKIMEQAGIIKELKHQVPFLLIPEKREIAEGDKKGRIIERKCEYKADFTYYDESGKYIVEDVKGVKTNVYKIKRKLMIDVYGIKIKEV